MIWPINNQSPLFLDGWLEFNHYKWGVTPLKLRLSDEGKELPAIETVLYLDKKGHIVQPPLNPYLPVVFYPTPTTKTTRLYRQWLKTSELLVEEFVKRGVKSSVAFCPEVTDIRQWQWHGFIAEVRYTFYFELPYDLEIADGYKRTEIRRAERAGFTCEIAKREMFPEVIECLTETESRKEFNYRLSVKDLELALDLLGEDVFRVYICRSPSGKLAYVDIILNGSGLRALGWVAGTRNEFLGSGASQLLIYYILKDLEKHGITGFDFVGANLPNVSINKAEWGGKLIPYYVIRPLNMRTLASFGWRMILNRRKRI